MPISILSSPQLIQPVYNPIYLQVSSDKTSEEAFAFIFDLYINGNFVNRDRLLPRPATNEAVYSPARILESYVSFDKFQNISGIHPSENAIDKYEIVVGEEYINPWRFNDNAYVSTGSTLSGYTLFYSTGTTSNPYVSGDTIYVVQDSGYTSAYYSGVFTVLSADSTGVIVDIKHTVNTPANGGLIYYSDRRKTVYTGATEILSNPEMIDVLSGWTEYSDISGNSLTINSSDLMRLTINGVNPINFGISTGTTKYDLIEGVTYNIEYYVSSIYNPTNGLQAVRVNLGGNTSPYLSGTGVFNTQLVCGSDKDIKLEFIMVPNGSGSHIVEVEYCKLSTINNYSGYSFNGVIQYEEVPTWDYTKFKMNNEYYKFGNGKFLTNQPLTVKTRLGERGSMGWMSIQDYVEGAEYYMVVNTTNLDHTPTIPLLFYMNSMGRNGFTGDTNDLILNWGVYPYNLNDWSQYVYGIDAVDETTESYTIQIYQLADPIGDPTGYSAISETRTFLIDQECTKYEPIRFQFLNALGQFDFFTATLLSRENININRTTYQKSLPYNYEVGDRGKTVLSLEGQQTYTVTSNWVDEDTCTWLMELFLSQEVYVLNDDGSLTPIIIDNTSVENKKRVNDGLLNYTFNFSKAITKNTQRN